jgi:hypothetical protein
MSQVVEINGKPAALVSVRVEDKINIGNFQNVTVEFGVSRWVEDDDDVIVAMHKHLAEQVCEPGLGEQREAILSSISS